jgi:TldD protein
MLNCRVFVFRRSFFALSAVASLAALLAIGILPTTAAGQKASSHHHAALKDANAVSPPLLDAMSTELGRAFLMLGRPQAPLGRQDAQPQMQPAADHTANSDGDDRQLPPYFLSYTVRDVSFASISAQFGALTGSGQQHMRLADVQVRVGSPKLDNTHSDHRSSAVTTQQLPLTDDREATMRSLWMATNAGYGSAIDNFLRVKTEAQVRAKEEDNSPDFSEQTAQVHIEKPAPALVVDRAAWEQRVRALSRVFRDYPDVYQNEVMFSAQSETNYFVSSEGSRLVTPQMSAGVVVIATTRADDGMDLVLSQTFQAGTADELPSQAEMEKGIREMAQRLEDLRKAPVTQPFDGPALLSGRAAAVFFHEVLGHRLEGQRQRGDEEGQTFTKDLGKPVLPSFLSVADDPTVTHFGNTWLAGSYEYDSEGQKAQRVDLIDDGVLKNFLMSRLPIKSFDESNGHGRAEAGHMPNGRQGNLIVTSTKSVPEAELRKQLIEEAKKQGKPYGLYFEDISSGFALTTRDSPQAFQVMPLVVWRVYVDGRPDELVRGVNIVGTPLAAMKSILATSDKDDVFNGICGAESGSVPVSAVAPAMLLSNLETQRQAQGSARPPILPIPGAKAMTPATKEAQ